MPAIVGDDDLRVGDAGNISDVRIVDAAARYAVAYRGIEQRQPPFGGKLSALT